MIDLARPNDLGRGASVAALAVCQAVRSARLMPANPNPPMRNNSRRVMPSHNLRGEERILSIGHLDETAREPSTAANRLTYARTNNQPEGRIPRGRARKRGGKSQRRLARFFSEHQWRPIRFGANQVEYLGHRRTLGN